MAAPEKITEHIWLDKELPLDVSRECLVPTATTEGVVVRTLSPLEDVSDVVMRFLLEEMRRQQAP